MDNMLSSAVGRILIKTAIGVVNVFIAAVFMLIFWLIVGTVSVSVAAKSFVFPFIRYPQVSLLQHILSVSVVVMTFALTLFLALMLRSFFKSLAEGVLFDSHNRRRIVAVGISLIALGCMPGCMSLVESGSFSLSAAGPGHGFVVNHLFNYMTLVVGAVVLAFSRIFRAGENLVEEQRLTV